MKKSTLITTIAMIVVVVVALSTATYAWFSTSTSAVATSATISTNSSADWTIADTRDGANADTDYIVNAASDAITLNSTGINSGLWTPVAAINTAFDDEKVGASGSINHTQQFITAKKSKEGVIFDELKTIKPDILKVTNATSTDKYLKVSVVLNAGDDTTRVASFYACAAVRFYMAFEINDKTNGGVITYTAQNQYVCAKQYGYSDSGLTTSAARSGQTTFEDKTASVLPTAVTSGDNLILANVDYDHAPTVFTESGTPTAFALAGKWGLTEDNYDKYGVAATDYIYMYNFELPYHFATGDAVNVLLFTWIDGWTAAAEAGGASFKVSYAFNTGSGTNQTVGD